MMTTSFRSPHTIRQNWRKTVLTCLAGAALGAGYAHGASPVDAEIGFAKGVPQRVRLTDTWTGFQYQVAVQADRDINGKRRSQTTVA
jgi:hypothetical protein